jgi:hypothetical protein
MHGLIAFAGAVAPAAPRVLVSAGDERNALLLLTVEADSGAGPVKLTAARLYLLDEDAPGSRGRATTSAHARHRTGRSGRA